MALGAYAIGIYFAFFAIVHSILADPGFKRWMKRILGQAVAFDRWQRSAYNLLAIIMVLPFIFMILILPDRILWIISAPWAWLMAGFQVLAAVCILLTLRQTDISYFLGLAQLRGRGEMGGLITDGFYCHTRNPLFFFAIVFLWLSPIMTENLLAFNILATIYFYLGAKHEERSLLEYFGQEYEDYRQRVPMFLPQLKC